MACPKGKDGRAPTYGRWNLCKRWRAIMSTKLAAFRLGHTEQIARSDEQQISFASRVAASAGYNFG